MNKTVPEKVNELFEYTGYNFSKSMFAALSIFGLLAPRGKRAWDRAQIDENGKPINWTTITIEDIAIEVQNILNNIQ